VRWPNAGKALGLGFDHGAEVVSTQGTLLLEIGSDGRQVVVGQGLAQKEAVGFAACFGFCETSGSGSLTSLFEEVVLGSLAELAWLGKGLDSLLGIDK
jgi:hypothetical protein